MNLPIYYQFPKDKNPTLISLNKYERLHGIPRNALKKYYYKLISDKLNKTPIKGKVKTEYTYFYKNSLSDAPNVISVVDKIFMDCLQINDIIKDDNVINYTGSSWKVGGKDKENPRVEIRVIEVVQ